jgi:hypothetical protein
MVFLRVFGIVLLLAAPYMVYSAREANQQNIVVLHQMEHTKLKDAVDSANYASALYHGSHSLSSEAGQWKAGGYASNAAVAVLVGLAFVVVGFRRRQPQAAMPE